MGWQLSSYVALLFLTSLLSVVVAYFVLRRRAKPGGLPLGLLMLAVAAWSFTLAFEAAATTIPAKVLWSKFEYLGVTSAPVLLLLFALEFTHREKWLKRRYVISYWIIPLISLTLAFTNEWHHLIWTCFTPIPGGNLIVYGHGAWFWIMVTYDYLVLSTATMLLLGAALRFRHVYRRQAIILFVGMFPPWLANILYVFDLGPPGWALTPIGFALTGLLLTWSLARLQLLDLTPVARDKVIESMCDGMLVLDAQNRIVDINPAAQKLIGVDGESAIGQRAEAILAQWTSFEDRYRDAIEAQGQVLVDGVGYIEWRTLPLQERGRRPFGRLIILRDVTAHKRAAEEIERRGEELESLREISLAITAHLELDVLLQDIVERGCRLLEVKAGGVYLVDETRGDLELIVSRGYTRDYTGTRLAPGEGLAGRVLQSGEPLVVDDYHHWEGQSPDWEAEPLTAVLGVPLKRGERVVGVLGFAGIGRTRSFDEQNIWLASLFANQAAIAIENARLYEGLRNQMDELKRTQARLVQSAKMAALGELAAGVAHELNNPLTAVLGFAELLLRDTALDDPDREDLADIAVGARRARDIVRNLLSFSCQTPPHRERASINQVVRDTLALVRQRLEKSGVTLEERYAPDLPLLRLDVGQMKQVVLNLVVNALQSTPRGGTLTITSERVGDEVALRIADTGVGVPAENLSHIFEPFFTTKPVGQGTGLGLSISLGIVQEHGGRIEVESQERAGSTFTVWLPVGGVS